MKIVQTHLAYSKLQDIATIYVIYICSFDEILMKFWHIVGVDHPSEWIMIDCVHICFFQNIKIFDGKAKPLLSASENSKYVVQKNSFSTQKFLTRKVKLWSLSLE